MKCFSYTMYSKDRQLRTETLCLITQTWRLILNDCSAHMAWRFTCAVWRLHFTVERLDKFTHGKRRTSTRTSSDGWPKLLPINDNVLMIIQGAFKILLIIRIARKFHGSWFWLYYKGKFLRLAVCRKRKPEGLYYNSVRTILTSYCPQKERISRIFSLSLCFRFTKKSLINKAEDRDINWSIIS